MVNPYEVIFKLLLGTLLGGIIGFERQTHGRAAGFRTQLLVCVACVLIMIISEGYYTQRVFSSDFKVDPTRIAAGALTGVGFLGAGVILKLGFAVQGLTTAACIWVVSVIGLAVGAGQYFAAVAGSVITFFALWVLRLWEAKMPRLVYKYITLVTDESGEDGTIRSFFADKGFEVIKADYCIEPPKKEKTFLFTIAVKDDAPVKEMIDGIASQDFVKKIEIKS
jgi:putative Mg2+ transporter-C (MgtC) family protein